MVYLETVDPLFETLCSLQPVFCLQCNDSLYCPPCKQTIETNGNQHFIIFSHCFEKPSSSGLFNNRLYGKDLSQHSSTLQN